MPRSYTVSYTHLINLGVAHGILGPLYVLALGFEKFNITKHIPSIEKGLSYYENAFFTNTIGKIIGWNGRVSDYEENEEFRFNISWCYGSLGMARVLYNIAKIIDSQKLREMATNVFTSSIDYLNSSETVSYTHLDVYKRQGINRGRTSSI